MLQWLGQLPEDEDFADRRPARRLTSTYFSMLPSARAAFSVPPRGTSAVGVRGHAERAPAPWFGSRCAPARKTAARAHGRTRAGSSCARTRSSWALPCASNTHAHV